MGIGLSKVKVRAIAKTNNMTIKKHYSDAPESNAGDDFHVLWTINKSFNLLNFDDNGLKAISVEGINSKNARLIDPYNDKLLGVDVVEYYGGEDFERAKTVIVSQIKYSTSRAEVNLSFFDLYKGKKPSSYDGSIIHRLAQIFKAHLVQYGRETVLEKLILKLVSRRDLNQSQKQCLIGIQKFLLDNPMKTEFNSFLKPNTLNGRALKKIRSATKLNSAEFSDFLRILDLTDSGQSSRYAIEIEIIQSINKFATESHHYFNSLYLMVYKKMMPESRYRNGNLIIIEDLLHCFELQRIEDLFPVHQRFEKLNHLIDREQLNEVLNTIKTAKLGQPICLHGEAGVGKSTFAILISNHIEKGSVAISFDCYGSGSYLNPSDKRHLHKEALLQLSNALAKETGSPFLLSTQNEPYIFLRQFRDRVDHALKILRSRDPRANLVLIVDAADNSIIAAEKSQTVSFVHDLANEVFSEGFKLIITSRTNRVSSLRLPDSYIDIELKPFNLEETREHLLYHKIEISDEKTIEFHELTKGNPRVQSYTLDLKSQGIDEVINYLKPHGKTVENLIEDKLSIAATKLGDEHKFLISSFFTFLITLPRPVPISYIASLSDLNENILEDLAIDIWHGLILKNNKLAFRDEDFENYIREKYKANAIQLKRISELFLEKADYEEYASINLGSALFEAGEKELLKAIVLEKKKILLPSDSIRNKEVYIERTILAMKICSQDIDTKTFYILSLIAAEASKTDFLLKNLLISNPDLVFSFGDPYSLEKIQLESDEKAWAGSFYYQLAAIYSRNKAIPIAKRHLKSADRWIEWLQRQREEARDRYNITKLDIALGAEAYLRCYGAKSAQSWLKKWSPISSVNEALNILMVNILKCSEENEIHEWLKSVKLRIDTKILISVKLGYLGMYPLKISDLANDLVRIISRGILFKKHFGSTLIDFCELLANSGEGTEAQITKILENVKVSIPNHIPSFLDNHFVKDESEIEMDLCLRKLTLVSTLTKATLQKENIYPGKFIGIDKEQDYRKRESLVREKKTFDRFYSYAISIYQHRANAICKENTISLESRLLEICDQIKNDWDWRYEEGYWLKYKLNFFALEILDSIKYLNKTNLIRKVIDSFIEKNKNEISLRIAVIEKVISYKNDEKICIELLNEIHELISESSLTSQERVNYYIRCAHVALYIDKNIGKLYFERAIDSITEIDIEAQDQIKCISRIAEEVLSNPNPKLACEFSRFVEFCQSRLSGYDHFPLAEGLTGISNLDPASSFAIVCRWDHRGVVSIPKVLLTFIEPCLVKDFVSPTIASSFLPINIYYWKSYSNFNEILFTKYDLQGYEKFKDAYVKRIIFDLQINCAADEKKETTKSLNEMISAGRYISNATLGLIREYNLFVSDVFKAGVDPIPTLPNSNEEDLSTNFDLTNVDILSTSSIENLLQSLKAPEDIFNPRQRIDYVLSKLKEKCSTHNYILHLNALLAVNTNVMDYYSFELAFKERLVEWDFHPSVKKWKKEKFHYALKIWFNHFNWSSNLNIDGIRNLAQIFSISDTELADTIINLLPEKINHLSATSIYQILALINCRLYPDDGEYIISRSLSLWNSKIKNDFGDGIWSDCLTVSSDPNKVVARFLRYLLGHPDLRIRWRAAHSLRRMVISGNIAILEILLEEQNNKDCNPFQNRNFTFYWISAKLYLWITIARLSVEVPLTIKNLRNSILNELFYKELPHVLIQYFIKQTCLNIQDFDNSTFAIDESTKIHEVLKSKFELVKEDRYSRVQRKYNTSENGEWRFKFDGLDTLPYWYNNLGEVFNLTEDDVADLADIYITEKWGYNGDPYKDDPIHLSSTRDYYLTSNRHGDLPTIEDLKTYYEYHAMFCAANDLLELEPLVDSERWNSWESWLKTHALVLDKIWLSDLRDPIPLEIEFWRSGYKYLDLAWLEDVDDDKYEETIGLNKQSSGQFIIPFGSYTRYFGKNYESTTIKSAIVSPGSSNALLRALQTTKNSFNYRIPLEDDELEIEEGSFSMLGWLKQNKSDDSGNLDQKDPFANGISEYLITFGKIVHNLFKIEYHDNLKKAYCDDRLVMFAQNWSDLTENNNYDKFESAGVRVQIDIPFLLKFLSDAKSSLIIECVISRHIEGDFANWKENNKHNTKIFLIDSDGTVKTIRRRSFKIG